jgi:hypothetical protein
MDAKISPRAELASVKGAAVSLELRRRRKIEKTVKRVKYPFFFMFYLFFGILILFYKYNILFAENKI